MDDSKYTDAAEAIKAYCQEVMRAFLVLLVLLCGCGGAEFSSAMPWRVDCGVDSEMEAEAEDDSNNSETSLDAISEAGNEAEGDCWQEPDAGPDAEASSEATNEAEASIPDSDTPEATAESATDTGTQDTGTEACVPDTCAKHNYACGTMEDGCGNAVTCGPPPFHDQFVDQLNCGGDAGLPPYFYTCTVPIFPPPFASCVQVPTGYCCNEA